MYLQVRWFRPREVLEVGALCGYSTFWLLQALADNGSGRLTTSDVTDHVALYIRPDTASGFGQWRYLHGDVFETVPATGTAFDYMFFDALHENWFAKRYTVDILEAMAARGQAVPCVVHDVYNPLMHPEYSDCLSIDGGKVSYQKLAAYMECFSAKSAKLKTSMPRGPERRAAQRLYGPDTPSGECVALMEWMASSPMVQRGSFTLSPFKAPGLFEHVLRLQMEHGLVSSWASALAGHEQPGNILHDCCMNPFCRRPFIGASPL